MIQPDETNTTTYPTTHDRPANRSDCVDGPRPCPLVGCPYNTYLTVDNRGNIKIAHGNRSPEDVPSEHSCLLDITDRGPQTLEDVGVILGLTRERIRQIEVKALQKLRSALDVRDGDGYDSQEDSTTNNPNVERLKIIAGLGT